MGEWIDLPVLADDDLFHVDLAQDIWENVYNLKNLRYAQQTFLGVSGGLATTASATFADVHSTVRLEFESFGGDLLVGVMVMQGNTNSNGGTKVRYELDGTGYGNPDGMMNIQDVTTQGFLQTQLLYLFRDIEAGDHTIDVQGAVGASNGGTSQIYHAPGTRYIFWVAEFP